MAKIFKTQFPQPECKRSEWLRLNGTWEFSLNEPSYGSTIQVPYPWGSSLSGFEDGSAGTGYYRKKVQWNPAQERIFLIFGAVDYSCTVRCNGREVGRHQGGYSRFELEVTRFWNRAGDNILEVDATDEWGRDSQRLGAFEEANPAVVKAQTAGKQEYGNARGIWQTVWLESRPASYIDSFFVHTALDGTVTYDVTCSDASDSAVIKAKFGGVTALAPVRDNRAKLSFVMEEPKWWSPEEPNLYEGSLTLHDGGKTDTIQTYFGIREISTGKFGLKNQTYITLNGKPYFINGVLDQSYNPKGYFTLPADDDCREEILRLKRLGLNMARIHIKAEEPLKLYWADRLGLLIMEDIPNFWGEPEPDVQKQYEYEMTQQILRDRNHPATFYWTLFNETWGLFHHDTDENGEPKNIYRPETAEWVVHCTELARSLDDTRLIEDNSECCRDHTITDVNTWHFYYNGYEKVKEEVSRFCDHAYPGADDNFKEGYVMGDVPCMNSECGNVWGVTGSAGSSDISWQYKYMINEFRRHDRLNGFIFTQFHDVVNEFNGYYKINNDDKDFGYDLYGMDIRDLHSSDYVGADFAPMTTVKPGDQITVPFFGSSFTDARHGKLLTLHWELICTDPAEGDFSADGEDISLVWGGYGAFPAGKASFTIPEFDGTALLSFGLYDGEKRIMQNGILFDIAGSRKNALTLAPADFTPAFETVIPTAMGKVSGLGAGSFTKEIAVSSVPGLAKAASLRILLEASTREPMTHDFPEQKTDAERETYNRSMGYHCDPSANRNTFEQTDSAKFPGMLEAAVNGICCGKFYLPDDPADSRGCLSHHYQPVDNLLEEAGSYGTLCDIRIPSSLLMKLQKQPAFTLTLTMKDQAGLSLYSRTSGRYGIGILLEAK